MKASKAQIDKIIFDTAYNYTVENKQLTDLLYNWLRSENFIEVGDMKLNYAGEKIYLTGTVRRYNEYEIPFIALLDSNMEIEAIKPYDNYKYTQIDNISYDDKGNYFVEATKGEAYDGIYSYTIMRFGVDKILELVYDKSDSEPYYSFYRGPSAPDNTDDGTDDDDDDDTDNSGDAKTQQEPEPEPDPSVYNIVNVLSKDFNNTYNLKSNKVSDNMPIIEKINKQGDTDWECLLTIPEVYEVPYINSAKGMTLTNGDFAFFLHLRNLSDKMLSVTVFRFDPQGKLLSQYQTPSYFGITDFTMTQAQNQLITGFVSFDEVYLDDNWKYPHTMHVISYPLK